MKATSARWLGIALLVAIFAAGAVVGAVVDRTWIRAPATTATVDRLPKRVDRFARRLDLSAEQRAMLGDALAATQSEVRAARDRGRQQIRALLTPEQAERYQKILDRQQARRTERGERRRDKRDKRRPDR